MLSLKGFHIFFIVASIALSVLVGAWGTQQYLQKGELSGLVLGLIFFVAGFALLVYGVRYFNKLRKLQ